MTTQSAAEKTVTRFQIISNAGLLMGVYEGESAAHALAEMYRDAGYPCTVTDGIISADDSDHEAFVFQLGEDGVVVEPSPIADMWAEAMRNPRHFAANLDLGQALDYMGMEICGEPEWSDIEQALRARGFRFEDVGGSLEVVEA